MERLIKPYYDSLVNEQIKDYENVIFDFTMNGGGGMSYFDDLIVAPNIQRGQVHGQDKVLARDT